VANIKLALVGAIILWRREYAQLSLIEWREVTAVGISGYGTE
jgi:hypothetical protein